uniref:Nucleic acid-binding, OB-fold protein n=1 Tax=Tanacetum cinerariifolium TaxID=118510 RepID=A0A699JZ95_TANCI|nr:nucleic acid-binding, OB-fold protein [Tanacetum cinerariifolium]
MTSGKKVIPEVLIPKCKNHGPQATTLYSYCFKAILIDGSTTISITCVINRANSLTRNYNELLAEIADKNPFHLPPFLKELKGTTHTFQFHFDSGITSRRPDFVLDTVFPNPALPMLAPPPQNLPNSPPTAVDLLAAMDEQKQKSGILEKLVGMKFEVAMAQIEAVGASKKEALKRSEATQKEIDELKDSTEAALKRAHMVESA